MSAAASRAAASRTDVPIAMPPMPASPSVARASESHRIHAFLRQAILDVTLVPGAAIVEAEVAERFGTSRTPVREALLRLSDEGLVDVRPQRGTYVARIALARVEEALFVREAVERAVLARIVARGAHSEAAHRAEAYAREQSRAARRGDVRAAMHADAAFHRCLVEAAGLPGVWDVVARARDLHHRLRAIAVPELRTARRAVNDHRRVIAALAAGDATAAGDAMGEHLARNRALARTIAQRHADYFSP